MCMDMCTDVYLRVSANVYGHVHGHVYRPPDVPTFAPPDVPYNGPEANAHDAAAWPTQDATQDGSAEEAEVWKALDKGKC